MALPDAGHPEEYTEEEMQQLLQQFETDKGQLTKNQKAAVARYNFKKTRGQEIQHRAAGTPPPPEAAPAQPTPPPGATPGTAPGELPPDMQALAQKKPEELTKEERIALAKAKSQAAKAAMAAKKAAEAGGAPAGSEGSAAVVKKSPEEAAAERARAIASKFLIVQQAQQALGARIKDLQMQALKTPMLVVEPQNLPAVLQFARDGLGMKHMACITAADYPPERIEVLYNVFNYQLKQGIAIKVPVPREGPTGDLPVVPTVTDLYKGADWLEREVYDMFGVRFDDHPNMKRLLLPEGWSGYPLRKDYDMSKPQYIGIDENGDDVVSFREADGW